MLSTVIGIGETGMGKSTFLNAYLKKKAFQDSNSPDSCTKKTSVDSNIINNQTRKAIDTPGIKDTDNTDQENVRQLVEFLLNYNDGINVVAIVLNGQNDRYTRDTEKFIKIAHQMFNHPDFWEHICIIFTKWYAVMNDDQKRIKQKEYKKRVIESIRKYTESDVNIELPMFFVDSPNYENEEKTKAELDRFNNFAFSKNAMKTTQAEVPNVFYEKVIPEKRENYRYKENYISEDKMKRTEYFADQSRNKLVDFDGNISYSDWKNDRQWEIVKSKTIRTETREDCDNKEVIPIYQTETKEVNFSGVCKKNEYKIMIGNKTVYHYTRKRRVITTDFDGNVSYGEWRIIAEYKKEEGWESSQFELYKYYKATTHVHPLKYLDTTMDNGWKCRECEWGMDESTIVKRFGCMQCDYNLCEKHMLKYHDKNFIYNDSNDRYLYLFKKAYYSKKHEHPLIFLDKSEDTGWLCEGKELDNKKCYSGITDSKQSKGIPRFRCDKCNFDLCENCMNYYRKKNVFKLNESYTVDCHQHPLFYKGKNDSIEWFCNGKDLNEKCLSGLNGSSQTKDFERFSCKVNKCTFNLCRNCMDFHLKEGGGCQIF